MKIRIAISTGDPAGIGPEVSLKAAFDLEVQSICTPVLIGDGELLRTYAKITGRSGLYTVEKTPEKDLKQVDGFLVYDVKGSASGVPAGRPSKKGGLAAARYIEIGAKLALEKKVSALVTAPICKESLQLAGIRHTAHTELLASITRTKEYAMFFHSQQLKIALLTTHLSLRRALDDVKKSNIVSKVKLVSREYKKLFGKEPKIGICAVNPHSGEGELFGDEEAKEIGPALEQLRKLRIHAQGPFPADTIFARAMKGEFDLVFAHYHDQGLIPIKSLNLKAVNITLGLPFVRTSPDHGTAFDIVGKDVADPASMIEAIKTAVSLSSSK